MSDSPRQATSMSACFIPFATVRGALRPCFTALALAAVTVAPATAAKRHSAAPAHAAVARPVAAHGSARAVHATSARAAQLAPVKLSGRHAGRAQAAEEPAPGTRAAREAAHTPAAGHKGRLNRAAGAEEQYVPLSSVAMAERSLRTKHTPGRQGANASQEQQRTATPPVPSPTPARTEQTVEQAADRSTQDRIHAWYRSHSTDTLATALPETSATSSVERAATSTLLGSASPVAVLPKIVSKPAPSAVAQTVLPADPTRTQQTQRAAEPRTEVASNARTTADDDAAFAEASNIPSTAPTEREPLPFVHGEFPAGPPVAVQRTPAAVRPKAPAVVRVDPRGDAEVLAAANNKPGTLQQLTVRDVAPALANKPAITSQSPTPAVSSTASAGRKPKLDAVVAGGMTSAALDDENAPAVSPAATQAVHAARGNLSAVKPAVLSGDMVALTGGPAANVNLYDGDGKLILLPPMKGSHEILVHQNQMAITDGLDRVDDDRQLNQMRQLKLLVALPDTDAIYPNDRLPLNRRYARPWAVRFLNDLGQAHFQRFHTPLIVTSAVRTVAFQRHLVLVNGNAAPPTGEIASPHLYGQAIDIAKRGMTVAEIAWMRSYLTPVETAGKIDVEEEFQQACFHISVYRRYLGLPASRPIPDPAPQRTLQLARTERPEPALRPMQRAKAVLSRHRRLPTALLAAGLR